MLSQTVEHECRRRPAAIVSEIAGQPSRFITTFGSTMTTVAPADETPDHHATNAPPQAYSAVVNQRGC
jgi:hypothetical protein